jgi:hypothetical protein
MRQRLHHRLRELEEARARAREVAKGRDDEGDLDRVFDKFRLFLQMRGTEQGPTESLAMASARALGIDCFELREQLDAGIDPIDKFLTDHGVLEEIEREKAAGTWPTAGGRQENVSL